jgi:hypothetical protein
MTRHWMHGTGWQDSVRRQSLTSMLSHGPFTTSMVLNGSSNGGEGIGCSLWPGTLHAHLLTDLMEFHCKIQYPQKLWSSFISPWRVVMRCKCFFFFAPSSSSCYHFPLTTIPAIRGCQLGLRELSLYEGILGAPRALRAR